MHIRAANPLLRICRFKIITAATTRPDASCHVNGIGFQPYFSLTCAHSQVCKKCAPGNWETRVFHSVELPLNTCIMQPHARPYARGKVYTTAGYRLCPKPARRV